MTVRRITSSVSCDICGATANSVPTGQGSMFSAASSAITTGLARDRVAVERRQHQPRRSRWTSSSTTSTELVPSRPASIEFASPA